MRTGLLYEQCTPLSMRAWSLSLTWEDTRCSISVTSKSRFKSNHKNSLAGPKYFETPNLKKILIAIGRYYSRIDSVHKLYGDSGSADSAWTLTQDVSRSAGLTEYSHNPGSVNMERARARIPMPSFTARIFVWAVCSGVTDISLHW
jgi:hypothetical protein